MSPSQRFARVETLFEKAGRFDYGCSIHSYDMAGYQIVVTDE